MNKAPAKIQTMRDQQLTRAMRLAIIFGFIALACSLSRFFVVGWHGIMYFHVALYLLLLAMTSWSRHLSYFLRAVIIVTIPYLLGVTGLLTWGLASFSLLSLFCFSFLSTNLLGGKAGIIASIISVVTIGIVGAGVITGTLIFSFDHKAYLSSVATWMTAMAAMGLSAGIIMLALGTLNRQIDGLIQTLERQNGELLEKNVLLQHEIAERVRAEEERTKLADRLQAAKRMEAIGTVAGGVAHDLNNILGGIVGYPDLLLEELPRESPFRNMIETIKKSGIKASVIVNDMLTLARSGIASTEVVNLNSIISEYCKSPEFEMLKKFHPLVEVKIGLDPTLMNIQGSPFHISKVVMNLVSNAAEALPDGGPIFISTENRNVGARAGRHEEIMEGEYAVLCVTDAGVGIPGEDLEKIFEPFYSKKKMGRSGTGLGMAVVWGAIKDHNGHIEVDSIEGKGTKFTLYFPVTQEQVIPVKPVPARMEFRGKGESILVVDDVSEQREITSRILQGLGYVVQAFGSGEEAIEYLNRARADLLILDMIMDPGIDGLETYRRISELHPGQKALITTGFVETERIKEALLLGIGGYLKKPYLIDDIGLAVRAELEKRTQGSNESVPGIWN
jgi:signal transduction histidine kinase/ActR/RegA family two-component response regulator